MGGGSHARTRKKDYCLVICHEYPLKHHEQLLVDGYRSGTWSGGWPHLQTGLRQELGVRIGTLTWSGIATWWPPMRDLPQLADLA